MQVSRYISLPAHLDDAPAVPRFDILPADIRFGGSIYLGQRHSMHVATRYKGAISSSTRIIVATNGR